MTRRIFNTSCDLYSGPGFGLTPTYRSTQPCRLVRQGPIETIGTGSVLLPYWLTCDQDRPIGAWTPNGFGMDARLADQVAIPSGTSPRFWVLYADQVLYHALTPYYRGYLCTLPIPPENYPKLQPRLILEKTPVVFPDNMKMTAKLLSSPPKVKLHSIREYAALKFNLGRGPTRPNLVMTTVHQAGRPFIKFRNSSGRTSVKLNIAISVSLPSAIIQFGDAKAGFGGGHNVSYAPSSVTTAGSCCVVIASCYDPTQAHVLTCQDNTSTSWTQAGFKTQGDTRIGIFYRANCPSINLVSVGGYAYTNMSFFELQGMNASSPLAGTVNTTSATSTNPDPTGLVVSQPGSIALQGYAQSDLVGTYSSLDSGPTPYSNIPCTSGGYINLATAGWVNISSNVSAGWHIGNVHWVALGAVFKP